MQAATHTSFCACLALFLFDISVGLELLGPSDVGGELKCMKTNISQVVDKVDCDLPFAMDKVCVMRERKRD